MAGSSPQGRTALHGIAVSCALALALVALQGCALYNRLYAEAVGAPEPAPNLSAAAPASGPPAPQPVLSPPAAQPMPNQPALAPSANVEKVVVVIATRNHAERSRFGGKIRNASMSRAVRFGDLDLTTPWGRTELKARIRVMAGNLCGQLERRYPIGISRGQSCYRQAVGRAMRRADEVIADPRYDYWKR